jgi:molybdopterin-containing oxidoreductase family membrane subunit
MAKMNGKTAELADNTADDPARRPTWVLGGLDIAGITDRVCGITEWPRPPLAWYAAFLVSAGLAGLLSILIAYLIGVGIGIWGLNIPIGWGFDITNFVFWIGIGHAGTLISAILFLCRQKWRTGINRMAEAMTIFAVMCAGIFPGIHIGRAWLAYWLAPYPNYMQVWPNFRSPLLWDVFAVSTYFTISLLFWYLGMIPDLAALRDRATSRRRQFLYGLAALGWRGSARAWARYEIAYLLLAGLATPLVLSVHSVVSFDFAVSILPGWHSTIFPPYFVAGAIFSGFAMVLTLAVPAREFFGLKELITRRHLENMTKILLATGLMVSYAYVVELFTAWYSANLYEKFAAANRALGPYAWCYWLMLLCNVVVPQFFWLRRVRQSLWAAWIIAVLVNVGMWLERFVIIVVSLSRDYLPSSWGSYTPTWVEIAMLIGSFGVFFSLFLLFCRYLPMVAMAEVKAILPHGETANGGRGDGGTGRRGETKGRGETEAPRDGEAGRPGGAA